MKQSDGIVALEGNEIDDVNGGIIGIVLAVAEGLAVAPAATVAGVAIAAGLAGWAIYQITHEK